MMIANNVGRDSIEESVRHLASLGFTELEAAVYVYLVENSPATAYRVAQGIGKPVANTYKAVESLQQKGAVLVDETKTRLCRAVPPDELLGRLEKSFETRREAAAQSLARLRPAGGDHDGIFTLTSPEQVYERCAQMLERARDVVLLDAFPDALDRLRPALEAVAARGVPVAVQAYAPAEMKGVDVIIPLGADRVQERWTGQWVCLMVDGAEYLFAYLDTNGKAVHQAIWSESAFLSWVHHSNLGGFLRSQLLERLLQDGTSVEEMKAALEKTRRWTAADARGYQALLARFGRPAKS